MAVAKPFTQITEHLTADTELLNFDNPLRCRIVTSAWTDEDGNDGNLYNLSIESSCGWAVPSGFAKYNSDESAQMTDLTDATASA